MRVQGLSRCVAYLGPIGELDGRLMHQQVVGNGVARPPRLLRLLGGPTLVLGGLAHQPALKRPLIRRQLVVELRKRLGLLLRKPLNLLTQLRVPVHPRRHRRSEKVREGEGR